MKPTALLSLSLLVGLSAACRTAPRQDHLIGRQGPLLEALGETNRELQQTRKAMSTLIAGITAPYEGYGFMLRVWDDTDPPIAGLMAGAEAEVAAWFVGGVFDSNYDPATEDPDSTMLSDTAAARGAVNSFLGAKTVGLHAESFADTTYVWIGGKEFCVDYFNISEGESGPPWQVWGAHDLRIGVFKKATPP